MKKHEEVVLGGRPLTPQTGCSITVWRRDITPRTRAVLYQDASGSATRENPVFTDDRGTGWFYVADGRYDLEVSGPNIETYTREDVLISEGGGGSTGGGGTPEGLGTMSLQNADAVNITGGQLRGVTLNEMTPGTMVGQNADDVAISGGVIADVSFTSGDVNITGGVINGVPVEQIAGGVGGGGGTMASQDADAVAITGGSISGVTLDGVTLQNVIFEDNEIVVLLSGSTQPAIGGAVRVNASQNRSFQATLTGTGTGPLAAEVDIEVSMDNVAWLTLATITVEGNAPGPLTEGFTSWAPWSFVRARLVAISGAGAALTANMGD